MRCFCAIARLLRTSPEPSGALRSEEAFDEARDILQV
jgi:hypothetical protein